VHHSPGEADFRRGTWAASGSERPESRTVAEHQSVIRTLLPRLPARLLDLAEASGRVLATDVVAVVPIPAFTCSAMDGYAISSRDVADAEPEHPVSLRVTDDVPAGRSDGPAVARGCAHRIMTGAPLPEGADAVVEVEATRTSGDVVEIFVGADPGRHVRRRGEDVAVGLSALPAGTVLGAMQLGLLAALGYAQVSVWPALCVLVVSAGSELVAPGVPPRAGSTYDSNGVMLATALRGAGAEARLLAGIPDDVSVLRSSLRAALPGVDLVLTSGGVSAGAYEVVKEACADVDFVDVALRPGRPQGAGRYDGVPLVAFPGSPIAALLSFEVLLRPALRAAMGYPDVDRPRVAARLTETLTSPAGLRRYVRGVLDPAQATVTPVTGHEGHYLRWLASAHCLIELSEDVTRLEAGTIVEAWQLS
jgi:molybdopterin molybdotransferase